MLWASPKLIYGVQDAGCTLIVVSTLITLNTVHDKTTKPLISIHQTNSDGSRLVLWDIDSDELIYEIDLTLNKKLRRFSEVKTCFSWDNKWLGVCSIGAKMVGLVCVTSGVFVWTARFPDITRDDMGCCTMSFDPSGTRLMISLGKVIYHFEPPCLATKPQKHPTHDNLCLSQASGKYNDFEILEMAREWPKQLLFNVLVAGQRAESENQRSLLDVAISTSSNRLAMVYRRYEGECILSILDYSDTSSWELLWLVAMARWSWCAFENKTSPLIKEIKGDQKQKGISVFYYPNDETRSEQMVLLSSKDGVEVLGLDSELNEVSDWKRISEHGCLSLTQTKDRRRVISLANRHVFIMDLNKKEIMKTVDYSFGLNQWWESFFDRVKFFAYSHFNIFTDEESDTQHKLLLQDKLRGLFDVSEDGETILIGWNKERKKGLVITPDKSEEQFRNEWDETHDSLYQCSMLTKNGKWIGSIDYEKMREGGIVVHVVHTESNQQQRIWLGSYEPPESKPLFANFFLDMDECQEKLTTLGLEEIGPRNKLKQFSIGLVHDVARAQDHHPLLEDIIRPTNLDRYDERDQPSFFNMSVGTISNFQRVLAEEGEEKMEEVAKCASHSKVKVSNVYRFRHDNEHDCTTFLTYALETKDASLVQLCLGFIKDGLFPFHSASKMVKDSFLEILLSYDELLLPIMKKNFLTFKVTEIMVPVQVFKSQTSRSNVVFTSDTILEPNEYFVNMAIKDLPKSKGIGHLGLTKDHGEGRNVLSSISFHYIADACKVGLNGIVRKLIMLKMDSSIFDTELVRATVNWKWEKLWKRHCVRQLCLYILFLTFFTSYAVAIGIYGDSLVHDKKVKIGISFLLSGAYALTIVFFRHECMQLKSYMKDGKELFNTYKWGIKHYFVDSQWNLLELTSYFLVLLLIPIFHGLYIFEVASKEALFVVVAIESILAWFKLWYYAQPFKRTCALVLPIRDVIHACLSFLILPLVILVGFSVALYVLFQYISNGSSTNSSGDEGEDEDLIHESFGSIGRSLSTLFYAMVGTLEVEVYYNHQSLSWLTTLIFILYISLEMIVMVNLLIAIMCDTFNKVKNEDDVTILIGRARFIDEYEASLNARQIREVEKQIGRFLYVLTPQDEEYVKRKTNWKGRINPIEENVKKAINLLEVNVENRISRNFEAINLLEVNVENRISRNFEAINLLEVNVENRISRNFEAIDGLKNEMQERFHTMERILQETLQEHRKMLEEHIKSVEEHRAQEEEH